MSSWRPYLPTVLAAAAVALGAVLYSPDTDAQHSRNADAVAGENSAAQR